MTLAEKQRQLVAKIAVIEDMHERLAALMSRAKKWPAPASEYLTEESRVHGCQSRVWLTGSIEPAGPEESAADVCRWRMECSAPMMKGLVALLCELYDGAEPDDVVAFEPALIEELGIARMISTTRLAGLAAVRQRIKQLAAEFAARCDDEDPRAAMPRA
jgi:cysteine desulfuration protein SufE